MQQMIQDIDKLIHQLSLKQQLLELLMLDIRYFSTSNNEEPKGVTTLPKDLTKLLANYPIGGIILFSENLVNPDDILNLTTTLQQHSQFGRFIGVDQEGGVVTRISHTTITPGNMALGAINDPNITTKIACIIGDELKTLGINLNFAPVLDINSNPNNPIIGVRSFGSNPELVATHGIAYINGLNQHNIISCVKHFPGHGNTTTDTHLGETYVLNSADAIEKLEIVPFKAAINDSVDMIMTAHIIAPQLDNQQIFSTKTKTNVALPATLSKSIITDLLRHKLGFRGVIASDAMDMQAITQNFTPVEATILALKAGIDIILMPIKIWNPDGIQNFINYFNQIYQICSESIELTTCVAESCKRILKLKQSKILPQLKDSQPNTNVSLTNKVATTKHVDFATQVAANAITLYRNNTLPWRIKLTDNILLLTRNNIIATQTLNTLANLNYTNVTLQLITEESTITVKEKIAIADKILLLTYNITKSDKDINLIIDYLNQCNKPYIMLSCRNPYDIMYINNVHTNVLVYGASGLDQTNYKINNFNLNLIQAITKIMSSTSLKQFNTHCPVDLES